MPPKDEKEDSMEILGVVYTASEVKAMDEATYEHTFARAKMSSDVEAEPWVISARGKTKKAAADEEDPDA